MSTPPADAVTAPTPRFAVGQAVRVKPGVADPDYPDIPLGGWAGVVREVETRDVAEPVYLVRWTDETLAATHPAYRRRCDRDGLEVEQAWIGEADLAVDDGGPATMEQPGELRPLPLDLDDPLDRARYLLGLTTDDDLPPIDAASLGRFHAELSRRLVFPFTAGDEDFVPVLVQRLRPAEEATEEGLLAEVARDGEEAEPVPLASLNPPEGTVGRRDLIAYAEWVRDQQDEAGPGGLVGSTPLRRVAAVVVLAAALVGGALAALEEAAVGAQVGAALVGLAGAFLGSGAESLFRRAMRLPPGFLGGLTLGLLAGGLVGAAAGALVVSYVGAIPGAIAGSLLARLGGWARGRPASGPWAVTGAWLGGMAYVFWADPWPATWGSLRGLLGGVALCVVGYFAFLGYMASALRGMGRDE